MSLPAEKQSEVSLRAATMADAALLNHWDEQPHVIQSDPNDDWHWEAELDRTPDWREFLIAEIDGRALGFIQLIDPAREETHYWGEAPPNLRALDIWIGEASDLGRGYGSRMMKLALERCFRDPGVTAVLIGPLASNTGAHRFYERFGFVPVGPCQFGQDHCLVMELSREAWRARNPP